MQVPIKDKTVLAAAREEKKKKNEKDGKKSKDNKFPTELAKVDYLRLSKYDPVGDEKKVDTAFAYFDDGLWYKFDKAI